MSPAASRSCVVPTSTPPPLSVPSPPLLIARLASACTVWRAAIAVGATHEVPRSPAVPATNGDGDVEDAFGVGGDGKRVVGLGFACGAPDERVIAAEFCP